MAKAKLVLLLLISNLDKADDETKPEKWLWRYCHYNCASCHKGGTDEDNQCDTYNEDSGFFFYCNQTKGHGIPGSCHNQCVNKGFYLKEVSSEEKEEAKRKCCPCMENCQICENMQTCSKCKMPFYLSPNNDSCVEDCGYCYSKDNKTFSSWQCVNCKTRYEKEKYNLNGTCYDEIPLMKYDDPDVYDKPHHIVDDKCNWLWGCKEGCFKCNTWYTSKCTKCKKGYYMEDFYSLTQKETFPCFKEEECKGIIPYQFDKTMQVGGVPKIINGEGVCYNCRLREGNYRQVENDFSCGPKPKRTFVNITHYNKLSKCYIRCNSCDEWGNSCKHNCLTCRDPSIYGLNLYPENNNKNLGNCLRYVNKCKGLPYIHDYSISSKLGLDEDNCGEDCDVCISDGKCPDDYPFIILETGECVEMCGFNEIMGRTCLLLGKSAMERLLANPFDLPNYDQSLVDLRIKDLIEETIIKQFSLELNISIKDLTLSQIKEKYFGKGNKFSLPKSYIISLNNISIELTSKKLESQKLAKIIENNINNTLINNITDTQQSVLDIEQCELLLKKIYNISLEEELIIIKGNSFREFSQYLGIDVEYRLYSTSLGKILNLDECKKAKINHIVSGIFNPDNIYFSSEFQKKLGAAVDNGYDFFSSESNFYNDICTPFTNENGNDVLLNERKFYYYLDDLNICKDGCNFLEYNTTTRIYSCECPNEKNQENEIIKKKLPDNFYKREAYSNIKVFKCSSLVFSAKGQKNNFGSYALLICLSSLIGIIIFYFIKGDSFLNKIFEGINDDNNNIKANPPKLEKLDNNIRQSSKENYHGVDSAKKDIVLNEYELNNTDYETALEKDQRSFKEIYWSFLKRKQLFIFTFYTYTDYNLRIIKITLFLLFISFYFAFTALFFNDSLMRQIYIYRGDTRAALHIPNIILSSLCCLLINLIINLISLNGRDIYKIKKEPKISEQIKKYIKIKILILFFVSFALIGLCWYYISAFCAVFKNSQVHYLINVLIAFIVCNIWPCVICLIPSALRKHSFSKKSSFFYKTSKILAYA